MVNMKIDFQSERGQAIVLLVLAMIGLLAFTALVIDGGMAFSERRNAQNAADAAALSGALAKINGGNFVQAALDSAANNGFSNSEKINVQVNSPPTSGDFAGQAEYIQVLITAEVETNFLHFVYNGQLRNTVEAVAHAKPKTIQPAFMGNALVALAPHGCAVMRSHGNANTTIHGGGIFDNSDDPNCAFELKGNAGNVDAPVLTIVGGFTGKTTPLGSTPLVVGYTPQIPYPPKLPIPQPKCTTDATTQGTSLTPGRVNGDFPPSGVNHLEPGIYCISGDFNLNGNDSLTGSDVLLYFQSGGNITLNGNSTIQLSAKNTGQKGQGAYPWDGLLIYVDPRNYVSYPNCNWKLNGTSDSSLVGSLYAPTCDIELNGTAGTETYHSQIVGYTIDLGGTQDLYMVYDSDENYFISNSPFIELSR
jgi:hypothetical protein